MQPLLFELPWNLIPRLEPRTNLCGAAAGPCSLAATGGCELPNKPLNINIPILRNVRFQGAADQLTVLWDTPAAITTRVRFMYRQFVESGSTSSYFDSPKWVPYGDGTVATVNTLPPETLFNLLLRPETYTGVGYWQTVTGVTSPLWNENVEIVMHNFVPLTDLGQYIIQDRS